MSRFKFGFIVLLISMMGLPSSGSASPELGFDKTVDKVSGWAIGISSSLNGCIAATAYTDNTTVWIGFSSNNDEAFIAITNPKWKSVKTDGDYQLIMLTNQRRWSGKFIGVEWKDERGFFASGLKRSFVLDLARSGGINVVFDQRSIARLSLRGSSDALSAALNCQKTIHEAKADGGAKPSATTGNEQTPRKDRYSSGTGFFVSDVGHVITNQHVIGGCSEIVVAKFGSPAMPARLVASDEKNDLAVLSTEWQNPVVPALAIRARVGESAYAYGFPLPDMLATSGNFTVGNIAAVAGLNDDSRMLQISTPVQPGNSGGPLIDQYGSVIGVIQSKLNALTVASKNEGDIPQNINFAIKSTIALSFLDANGIPFTTGTKSSVPLDAASVAEKARLFTVHIVCR